MQMVILAGGLATRLRPLTEDTPKSMVPVHGKPFLEHQIDLLKKHDVTDIVLCVGHLADRIEDHFGDGKRFGVRIRYSRDGDKLLGTGGALKNAQPLLDTEFFCMYGDSYLLLDYEDIAAHFSGASSQGLMVVYKNHNRLEPSNVVVRDGLVAVYDKRRPTREMVYIDEGLLAFRRSVLDEVAAGEVTSLQKILVSLVERNELMAYETPQRFYTIGTASQLEEFRNLIARTETPS